MIAFAVLLQKYWRFRKETPPPQQYVKYLIAFNSVHESLLSNQVT